MNQPSHAASDADLVRLLDEEFEPERRTEVLLHIQECEACSTRLIALREIGERVQRALDLAAIDPKPSVGPGARPLPPVLDLDHPSSDANPAQPSRAWGRAAAILAAVAALGLALSPVRAFVADLMSVGDRAIRGAPAEPDLTRNSRVSFAAAGGELTIRVRSIQRAGSLFVRLTEAERASARIVSSQGSEELVVLPSALEIVSGEASTASYLVEVPRSLNRLVVELQSGIDTTLWLGAGPPPGTEYQFSLGPVLEGAIADER